MVKRHWIHRYLGTLLDGPNSYPTGDAIRADFHYSREFEDQQTLHAQFLSATMKPRKVIALCESLSPSAVLYFDKESIQ